jgi:hypothetical protein
MFKNKQPESVTLSYCLGYNIVKTITPEDNVVPVNVETYRVKAKLKFVAIYDIC